MQKLKKWIVSAATVIALAAVGYYVGDWDDYKGYPVFNGVDTIWCADSARLIEVTDSLNNLSKMLCLNGEVVLVHDIKTQLTGSGYSAFEVITVGMSKADLITKLNTLNPKIQTVNGVDYWQHSDGKWLKGLQLEW